MYRNSTKDNSKISEVLYPFGFGLSYTQFSYGKLEILTKTIDAKGTIKARVKVKNSGLRAGDEVIQLYAHDEKSSVQRPEKQLVCFERIHLLSNESKVVDLEFPAKDLAFWSVATNSFVVEPGSFKLMVGSSSVNILSTGKISIK